MGVLGAFFRRYNLCRVYTGNCQQPVEANATFRGADRSLLHTLCPLVSGAFLPLFSLSAPWPTPFALRLTVSAWQCAMTIRGSANQYGSEVAS